MKKIITIFVIACITTTAFSQKRNTLKGPEYKNYKNWEHKIVPVAIFTNTAKQDLKGPDFKNFKVSTTEEKDYKKVTLTKSKRTGLKGPAYKNFKPWKKE